MFNLQGKANHMDHCTKYQRNIQMKIQVCSSSCIKNDSVYCLITYLLGSMNVNNTTSGKKTSPDNSRDRNC